MQKPTTSSVEAPGQAAGYLYQLRYALLSAIKKIPRSPTGTVTIERLDDVGVFEDDTADLSQLKHTSQDSKSFTDNSVEIWRTLAIWSDILQDVVSPTFSFFFVTNGSVAASSAFGLLSADDNERNPEAALDLLNAAATKSRNQTSADDRQKFLKLDPLIKTALVRAITVVANAPGLASIGDEIEAAVFSACEANQLSDFRQDLEGWWLDIVSTYFAANAPASVSLLDLQGQISYLREKYKASHLTIDVEDPGSDLSQLDDHRFVDQIKLVKAGAERLRNAQRNFMRASAQRSKWIRSVRVDPEELRRYDDELTEKWNAKYAIACDELSSSCTDDEKCTAGRSLLGWAETQQVAIKGAAAQFLTSGSYHALADELHVGWHPEFRKLMGAK